MIEVTYLLNCRSLTRSIFQIGVFSNKWIVVGTLAMIILQISFTYIPTMNIVFQTSPIDSEAWIRIIALAIISYIILEVDKWVRRVFGERIHTNSYAQKTV